MTNQEAKAKISKQQTLDLLETVQQYYPRFTVSPVIHTAWHNILTNYDYQDILDNFNDYVVSNPYPPKVSDLVKPRKTDTSVPNVEETSRLLQSYEKTERANEEVVQQNLAKIRSILGIRRN